MKLKKAILGVLMCGALIAPLASCKVEKDITPATPVINDDNNNDDNNDDKPTFYTYNVLIKYLDQETSYKKITSDNSFSLDTIRPSVEEYEFKGWYKDANYTVPMNSVVSYSPSTIVVYAKMQSVHYNEIEKILNLSKFDKNEDFYSYLSNDVLLEYDEKSRTAQGKFFEQYAPLKQGYDLFELYWEKDVLCLKYQSDTMGAVEYISLPIDKIQSDYNSQYIEKYNFLKNEKFEYQRHNSDNDYKVFRRTDTKAYNFTKENNYSNIYDVVIETNEIFSLTTYDVPNIGKIDCNIPGYEYNPKWTCNNITGDNLKDVFLEAQYQEKSIPVAFVMDGCSACDAAMSTMVKYIKENNGYFLNVKQSDYFVSDKSVLVGSTWDTLKIFGTPTVIVITNGKVSKAYEGALVYDLGV